MNNEVDVQIHLWPWSAGNPRRWPEDKNGETVDLIDGTASFPYYGSPVLSVSSHVSFFLPNRHERFLPFGPSFHTDQGCYQLFEMPHGILTGMKGKSSPKGLLWTYGPSGRSHICLIPEGARMRTRTLKSVKKIDTALYGSVLSWSQQFDALIEMSNKRKMGSKLPWQDVLDHFLNFLDKIDEPRMAMIVKIAEEISNKLSLIVNAARKILLRERRMLPAGRVAEVDTRCLRWLGRQQGESLAQKAASHKQRILGVARQESFDTLENRVLKDFLSRCMVEASRYMESEVGNSDNFRNSKRAIKVRAFRHLCGILHSAKHFKDVAPPPTELRPNYVLQNDFRYRQVWRNYVRLLRKEDEEDCLWDWQARTWADVVRIMVCLAVYQKSRNSGANGIRSIQIKELFASGLDLSKEQKLGCRINHGCEPGPFVLMVEGRNQSEGSVLEIIHPFQAEKHHLTREFGRLGGSLYLAINPFSGGKSTVVVVWAVHTAGTENHPGWTEIGKSAGQALQRQEILLGRRADIPRLKGFVAASDLEKKEAEVHPGKNGGVDLVQIPADPRSWPDALAGIEAVIEDILRESL